MSLLCKILKYTINVLIYYNVYIFQSFILKSSDPLARSILSYEKAKHKTLLVCPFTFLFNKLLKMYEQLFQLLSSTI